MRGIVLVLLAALAACESQSNTQYVPVGTRCGHDTDCGTSPYSCNIMLPAGYCTKTCGASDADCPMDSKCMLTAAGNQCRRTCSVQSDCRTTPDGYSCKPESGVSGISTVC